MVRRMLLLVAVGSLGLLLTPMANAVCSGRLLWRGRRCSVDGRLTSCPYATACGFSRRLASGPNSAAAHFAPPHKHSPSRVGRTSGIAPAAEGTAQRLDTRIPTEISTDTAAIKALAEPADRRSASRPTATRLRRCGRRRARGTARVTSELCRRGRAQLGKRGLKLRSLNPKCSKRSRSLGIGQAGLQREKEVTAAKCAPAIVDSFLLSARQQWVDTLFDLTPRVVAQGDRKRGCVADAW